MALNSIDAIASIDFQAANLWDFVLIDNPNINSVNALNILAGATSSALGVYNVFKVTSTSIPFASLENITLKSGHKPYTAKSYEANFSLTIMEDTSFSSYNYFNLWFSQIFDFEQNVFKSNPPTKTGILTYYGSDLVTPTAMFFYDNVRLLKIQDITVDRQNSNPLTLTVDFSFEKMSSIPVVGAINNITKSAVAFLQSL